MFYHYPLVQLKGHYSLITQHQYFLYPAPNVYSDYKRQQKEFSLLYLVLNNLSLFQENIHLIENIKFFTDENKLIFDVILSKLKSGEKLTLIDLEIDDLDEDVSNKSSQEDTHAAFVEKVAESEDLSTEDVVATKLDLAKAYVEVSDKENAKTILDEVLVEGDEEQRKQAQILLDQI